VAHLPDEVHRLFAQQHGVAATTQLLLHLTSDQIERFEFQGTLVGILRGVYRSPSWPVDELTRCAAVCLGRPYVSIAGPTAGRRWRFRRLPADQRIHVIAPPARKPVAAQWVVAYRTAAIRQDDVIQRADGIRITSRARTALDLARFVGPDDLLSIIEQAMHDGGLSESEMAAVAVDFVSPKRPWLTTYLRQFARRTRGAPAESHPEVRVMSALSAAGVTGLVRQLPITLPGYGDVRFDLAVPGLRWAIEVDVHPRHEETVGAEADMRRDEAALAIGWTTSRVSRDDYEQRFEARIAAVAALHRHLRLAA
jgi:very-short-patch-repair endonuclease